MTAAKVQRTCAHCRFDGGWHYDDDGNATRCPNYLTADAVKQAHALVDASNEQVKKEARRIVREAAERFYEFSANQIRDEIEAAQIPGSAVGSAFTWAKSPKASEHGPLIKATGRRVMSTEDTTRHAIDVWQSLVWRHGRAVS